MINQFHPKYQKKYFWISALKLFVASWRLPGSFLGIPGDLVSNIIDKEAYRKPRKAFKNPREALKTFNGEILKIFQMVFMIKTMTPKRYFEINQPLQGVICILLTFPVAPTYLVLSTQFLNAPFSYKSILHLIDVHPGCCL